MRDPATIKAYHRRRRLSSIIGLLTFVGYIAAWMSPARSLANAVAEAGYSRWVALGLLALALGAGFELLTLPLAYYRSYVLEHRFGLSNETRSHWLGQRVKSWLVGAAVTSILLATLYGLLWHAGRTWWAWVWGAWLLLTVGLAKLFPLVILPLFYPTRPVEDEALCRRLTALAEGTGISIDGVFMLDLSAETRKVNAMLTGLGASRRVFLSDTLLEAFSLPQIEVVFAHELAHHVRGHIGKGLLLSAVVSSALVAAIAWRLDPIGGPNPELWPAALSELPAAILVATGVQLLLQPVGNAVSRHFERQCDADALHRTGDRQVYRETFEKLGEINLADPNPPRIVELLFHDHPALAKRIAMADAHVPTEPVRVVDSDAPRS